MLRAITFDFWGTLYQNAFGRDERLRLLEQFLQRHNQPRPWTALEGAYLQGQQLFARLWREEHRAITVEEWLDVLLDGLGVNLPKDTVVDLFRPIEEVHLQTDEPIPVPGVPELLPRLARRYPLGLISDVGLTPARVLRERLRRDGLLPHFRCLTFSDEVGATKPLPKPFLHTLSALGATPEEAVHIGDLPETDIAGAKGVGMRAVLFLGVSHRKDGRELADATFEDYSELEGILEKLGIPTL